LALSRNSIIILGLVGAFILGTLSANPVVDALSPMIELLTDATFGLEAHQQSTLSPENLYLYLGDTVTTVDSVATVVLHTSIAIGTDGNPVISYYDVFNQELNVAHCNDIACTSAATTTVDSDGNVGASNSIAIGTDGFPVISYSDFNNGNLKVAHCNDIACTSAATITTIDSSSADVGSFSSIAIGTDDFPVISYRNNIPKELKVAHCIDIACTSAATITIVDSGGGVGAHTSIAIGTDDFPVISYSDSDTRDLKVAHCIDIACTSAATITTIDSVDDVGQYNSIAIGTDGLPVISYFDSVPNNDLKIAHCDDIACTSAVTITVDSSDDVGNFTSIAIGTDGLPVISYRDFTNDDLKVAHCNDVACTNFGTTTVDTGVDVGFSTSIAIGTDGFPVISHLDTLNDDLKVVHCNDPLCSPVL